MGDRLRRMDIKYLQGVGPKRAEAFAKELEIRTFNDLLYYFPFRYIDRSTIHKVNEVTGDMPYIQLRGHFITFTAHGEGRRRRLQALFTDGTGTIEVVWFNRVKYIQENYHTGIDYLLFGKPTPFGHHYSIIHPEIDVFKPEALQQGLQGVYSLTERLQSGIVTNRVLQKIVSNLLAGEWIKSIQETLPDQVIRQRHLMPLPEALVNMHHPSSIQDLQRAQFRMKYEELFYLELNILHYIKGANQKVAGFVFPHIGEMFNNFYNHVLQFPLTNAQKRVIKEIRRDMGSGRQMNRLLQGDVGSGKTIVAFMCMLIAVDNGYQACIMAPTEILATQHYETISELAKPLGLNVALLTGSSRKKEREMLHQQLQSGELNILIGTHALIEDNVQFSKLGLAVIDEQHRFGVAQRAKLWKKSYRPPHVLVMTATPIPRTLAMTVYGDLDVSVIDELPPGRKPVTTLMRYDNNREQMYRFLFSEVSKGRQVYIVYPLIEENEKLDLLALEEGYEIVREMFPSLNVTYVHGRMKPAEKDHQMELFARGKSQILVATTVIEVGVNVPNASVMVIENAERFGLSQLHQLRGRVGRGADQSYCILMTKQELARETRHRLEVMTQTSDGFVIAEEDMKLRGPGDMEGTQQSGIAFNLKVANLVKDGQIIQLARDDAEAFLKNDPTLSTPDGQMLDRQLHIIFNKQTDWSQIS
ncbi:MAG: ATP-dependent DNA helicase RecG [Bacteroidales bacterium]|nr:ATP-dependent DNA helicase RecG [Candidatus Sodaliphilus aphodohippi]